VPERDARGEVVTVLGIARDVTVQREAEAARRESELRLRQVTETIDEVFWLTSADKNAFFYVSPAYERLFGRPAASLHADARSWQEVVHVDDLLRVQHATAGQAAGSYDIEYRIHRGGEVRWIRDRAFPIYDEGRRVHRIAGVAEDITQRKRLEEQLRHAQKMEAIGQLAGGIAHDFNNMLSVIQLQAAMLLNDLASMPDVAEGLREILGASERAANLTRQLLTLGRRQVVVAHELELESVLDQVLSLLRGVIGERIAIETDFAPGLPHVHADPGMIEQVMVNLAINARDAMPLGGTLSVGLGLAGPEVPHAARAAGDRGPWLELRVADTGHGIPPGHLTRIFEPFFTTKALGKGTGLGLATVFAIVAQHGGHVEVDSEVGRGTIMKVYLPALGGPSGSSLRPGLGSRAEVSGG
jgi:PAS domain S-box-containing protein